nr:hypothetical protein [Herbaspirillum rhizosphaerae]
MHCKRKFWKILVFIIAGVAALGFVVMSLWNWLMPSLFAGAHQIDYLHALGLFVLCKILFGGFRGRGCHHDRRHRWEQMSEEERQKFKEGMRGFGRFRGGWHRGAADSADVKENKEPPQAPGSV